MIVLGLDFDNTLVEYDELFYTTALDNGLIPNHIKKDKTSVRDYLRSNGNEDSFTLLQGEVYGKRILEAEPTKGLIQALTQVKDLGIAMVLVSHKTKKPFQGPSYDLHQAAWNWLDKYNFLDPNFLGWDITNVFFEETKANKINRIISEKCTNYVDDLPEILEMIPDNIVKHLYDPSSTKSISNCFSITNWIQLLDQLDSTSA